MNNIKPNCNRELSYQLANGSLFSQIPKQHNDRLEFLDNEIVKPLK